MAARDGIFRDGLYHFECEACGNPTTARRSHARACSSACAARLRRNAAGEASEHSNGATEIRFYISQRKLEASLAAITAHDRPAPELVVGFDRGGEGPELARLRIETTRHDDGGLVCCLTAPFDPFERPRSNTRR